jgi:hypothetical protein
MDIIPLGTFCQLAGTLERAKLRTVAYPFDHIRSNPAMVSDCLLTHFKAFLDQNKYYVTTITDPDGSSHRLIGIKDESESAVECVNPVGPYGYDVFVHHNVLDPVVHETFVRRVERLYDTLCQPKMKLVLVLFQPWGTSSKTAPGRPPSRCVVPDGRDLTQVRRHMDILSRTLRCITPPTGASGSDEPSYVLVGLVNLVASEHTFQELDSDDGGDCGTPSPYVLYQFTTQSPSQGYWYPPEDEQYFTSCLRTVISLWGATN